MSKDLFRATARDAAAEQRSAAPPTAAPSIAPTGAPGSNGAGHAAGNGTANGATNGAARQGTPPLGTTAVGVDSVSAAPATEGTSEERAPRRQGDGGAQRLESEPRHAEPVGAGPSGGGGDGLRVHLEFDFPSDVAYIERVVSVVIRQCEEFGFPPRQCALNVPVALTEALSNAILRGNGDDRSKQVRVRARVDDRGLVMEIADEGNGFDYSSCMRDPTAPENLDREDGRGLYLMQRLMDRVERFSDHGNVVRLTLTKRG